MKQNFYIYRNGPKDQFLSFSSRDIGGNYRPPRVIKVHGVPFYYTGQKYKVTTREQAIDAYKMWLAIK